ncbi:hypothetical protein E2C01_070539 [Portunus trituberculatus]|uniref:Uncharacterized protein n=1 Tax=Portunus trituberculatus TaxID=210409 RepID=A0A5B7I5P9_PORTR|nr:hypothetical protein [Portunus trituberculatus]
MVLSTGGGAEVFVFGNGDDGGGDGGPLYTGAVLVAVVAVVREALRETCPACGEINGASSGWRGRATHDTRGPSRGAPHHHAGLNASPAFWKQDQSRPQ